MKIYCARQGKSMNSLRFLVDGERIRPDQTPAEVSFKLLQQKPVLTIHLA